MGLAAAQARLLILTALKKPEVNKPESDNNNNVEGDLFDAPEAIENLIKDSISKNFKSFA